VGTGHSRTERDNPTDQRSQGATTTLRLVNSMPARDSRRGMD